MKKILLTILILIGLVVIGHAQEQRVDPAKPSEPAKPAAPAPQIPGPAFKDVLSLKSVGSPVISPCGKHILFTVDQPDWEKNKYDTEIWLSQDGTAPFQLTQTTDESSDSPSWSPDGRQIAFLANRDGKSRQIYLISPGGGEAFRLTDHKEGVDAYEWSPSGRHIAFTSTEPQSKELKGREKQYGKFEIEDAEYRMTHLWLVSVEPGKTPEAKRLTSGMDFTVDGFAWSPDGKKIAFAHRPDHPRARAVHVGLLDQGQGLLPSARRGRGFRGGRRGRLFLVQADRTEQLPGPKPGPAAAHVFGVDRRAATLARFEFFADLLGHHATSVEMPIPSTGFDLGHR